jgi:DUF917 family protein
LRTDIVILQLKLQLKSSKIIFVIFQFKTSGLVSIEIGGMNGIDPLLTAAELGIPVIDADLMGRAFPELQVR